MQEVQSRGAGEIVLNCMASDGVRKGYDLEAAARGARRCAMCRSLPPAARVRPDILPICSNRSAADAALAASVFHSGQIAIPDLKQFLRARNIEVRP